jgi:hypothetical protein
MHNDHLPTAAAARSLALAEAHCISAQISMSSRIPNNTREKVFKKGFCGNHHWTTKNAGKTWCDLRARARNCALNSSKSKRGGRLLDAGGQLQRVWRLAAAVLRRSPHPSSSPASHQPSHVARKKRAACFCFTWSGALRFKRASAVEDQEQDPWCSLFLPNRL